MNPIVALRAAAVFLVLTLVFGALGVSAYAPLAEALFVISASVGGLMLAFGLATARIAPQPVRALAKGRRRRR
jgi:hypothetical protein